MMMSQLMGIINVTPDSYVSHSRFCTPEAAVQRALELIEQGADSIDIGGESTRPGAAIVNEEEECRRVIPVVDLLRRKSNIPISIDTMKPLVARRAIEKGATIINDIYGFRDEKMVNVAVSNPHVKLVVMHMRGTPQTMQHAPSYPLGIVPEIVFWLKTQASRLEEGGVAKERIFLDPGIGFGKTVEHNIELMRGVYQFRQLGYPLLYGISRKSFLGALTSRDVGDRLPATLGVSSYLMLNGVSVLRVHDVAHHDDVRRVLRTIAAGLVNTPVNPS
jgi:dihydropteroate synthase